LRKGEVVGVVGPSGSGKSSLLRALVGLLAHDSGTVSLDGQAVNYADRASLARARDRIAIVFQQFNLFQNMTVLRNVTLAPLLVSEGMAMVIVSHEMEFIREISSRVLMFDGGKVIADSTTDAFFTQPQTERATQFLQRFNRVAGGRKDLAAA